MVEGRKGGRGKGRGERGWGGREEVKVNVHVFMFIHCGDMGNSTCTCVRQQFAQVEGPKRTALQVLTRTHTHTLKTHSLSETPSPKQPHALIQDHSN